MATRGVLSLVATGVANESFPLKYATDQKLIDIKTNELLSLPRTGDTITIGGLLVPKNIRLDRIKNLIIEATGSIIINIPFDIWVNLVDIRILSEYIFFPFPNDILNSANCDAFVIKSQQEFMFPIYSQISIRICSDIDFSCKLSININTYDMDIRNYMMRRNEISCSLYEYKPISINNNTITIDTGGLSNGIYLLLDDEIDNISLRANNMELFSYDKIMIEIYEFKKKYNKSWWPKYEAWPLDSALIALASNQLKTIIGRDVYDLIYKKYIYYNEEKYFYHFSFGKYINGNDDNITLNLNRLNDIVLDIKTKNDKYKGHAYICAKNILLYANGVAGLRYAN